MIYTLGYGGLKELGELAAIVAGIDAVLIDVRSKPNSVRRREFSGANIRAALGDGYEWHGDTLGGFLAVPKKAGLAMLERRATRENLVLMCAEHEPAGCHRHLSICSPHFPDALHIYEGFVFTAAALDAALDSEDDDLPMFELKLG